MTPTPPPADEPHTDERPALQSTASGLTDPVTDAHKAYVTLLFNKYRSAVYRYLTRLVTPDDAAELVQETYFRLVRHDELVQMEDLARSFLFQTATNLARDHRRRQRARRQDDHVDLDTAPLADPRVDPERQVGGRQLLDALERSIAAMPQDMRTVFILSRYRDMNYAQIAQVLRLGERTVARKMAEAIERLSLAVSSHA